MIYSDSKCEFQFGFLGLIKTVVYGDLQAENKMKKNKKKNSLKHQATGVEVLGQMRGSRVLFLALGRMTYSHFPNRIFIWLSKLNPNNFPFEI